MMTEMFEPLAFESKPAQVMAIQVHPKNLPEVAKWANADSYKVEYDLENNPVMYALNGVDESKHRSIGGKFGSWIIRDHEVLFADDGADGDVVHYAVTVEDFEERFRKGWS